MLYVSTRTDSAKPEVAPPLSFSRMVFSGTAPDGGLYVPEKIPLLSLDQQAALRERSYAAVAGAVLAPFCMGGEDGLSDSDLAALVDDLYGPHTALFDTPEITPLRALGDNLYLLELFHGPTLAFKDLALQFLGRLFDHLLAKDNRRVTILGATSGDTGSAAIAACAHMSRADIFILHPAGRVSDIQRRQMTTVTAPHVHNIAIDGTFDDAQAIVKALFADQDFSKAINLTAINSINWARIAAQIVYYVRAALLLGDADHPVSFTVPTGNFGNIFAGFMARRMGLPIKDLVIASNRNDILTRFFETGDMAPLKVEPSCSPSMDIQISSNFERYVFELLHREGRSLAALMQSLATQSVFHLPLADLTRARAEFSAYRASDDDTIATIAQVYDQTGIVVDPHTAVGLFAAKQHRAKTGTDTPMIALACAHPAKFPEVIRRAIGRATPLPPTLSDLMSRPEHFTPMRAEVSIVRNYIQGIAGAA